MRPAEIIRAAIPGATHADIEHVLWGRTPYPFEKLTARSLYKAASGFARAGKNGIFLCDHCPRVAESGRFMCLPCANAIRRTRP